MRGDGRSVIVRRLARLMVLCETRRVLPSLQDLAQELGVHPRTIRRDLAVLSEAGWPVPPVRAYNPVDMRGVA